MLNAGDPAPEFSLPASTGETVSLASLRGRKVILFFYPKDDTPGCTVEACGFQEALAKFAERGVAVLGVSGDSLKSHGKFAAKYGLEFPLLSDEDHTMAMAYGVWVEKSLYGRKYMGMERTTFVITEDGKIARIFRKVKPAGHAAEVLEAARAS